MYKNKKDKKIVQSKNKIKVLPQISKQKRQKN
jgi:hypothetical protein